MEKEGKKAFLLSPSLSYPNTQTPHSLTCSHTRTLQMKKSNFNFSFAAAAKETARENFPSRRKL